MATGLPSQKKGVRVKSIMSRSTLRAAPVESSADNNLGAWLQKIIAWRMGDVAEYSNPKKEVLCRALASVFRLVADTEAGGIHLELATSCMSRTCS